jgi:hypothetical protein
LIYVVEVVAGVAGALLLGTLVSLATLIVWGLPMTSAETRRLVEEAERHLLALHAIAAPLGPAGG